MGDNETMARKFHTTLLVLVAALVLAGTAQARGGNYVFVGGSDEARAQVRAALEASRFNWSALPHEVTIEITRCGCAGAQPGRIVLDEDVLTQSPFGPRYAWGIVQDEYAHQIDFLLLREQDRRVLRRYLGGADWCYERAGLRHDDHACERFSTAVSWAFWTSEDNVNRPRWRQTKPFSTKTFRRLVNSLVNQASLSTTSAPARAA